MDVPALSSCCFVKDVNFANELRGDEMVDEETPEGKTGAGLGVAVGKGNGVVEVYTSEWVNGMWQYEPQQIFSSPHNHHIQASPISTLCCSEYVPRGANHSAVLVSGSALGEVAQFCLTRPGEIDSAESNQLPSIFSQSAITHVTIDKASLLCASADAQGMVQVFELGSDQVRCQLKSTDGTTISQSVFVNSNMLVTVGVSPGAQMMEFDLRQSNGRPSKIFQESGRAYHSVAIHTSLPDTIATGSDDGTVTLWDSRNSKVLARKHIHSSVIDQLSFHPLSPSTLLSIGHDGLLACHSVNDNEESRVLLESQVAFTQLDTFVSQTGDAMALVASDTERLEVLNLDASVHD